MIRRIAPMSLGVALALALAACGNRVDLTP